VNVEATSRRTPRLTLAAAVAAAGGLTLLTAAVVPAGSAPVAARPSAPAAFSHGEADGGQENPAEAAAGQQAFGAAHFGGAGLETPHALQLQLQRGTAQAAAVPTSDQYGRDWRIRGPRVYRADDASRSGTITNLGFHTLAGRVTSIATTQQRPSLVWVATAGGGVWRSTDRGKDWTPRFDKQPTTAIGAIAIDPTDPSRVYVGTGEANTNADAYYGEGMFVTNDSGRTWHHVSLPGVLTVFHVEIAKQSPGFPAGRVFAATNHGLFLSTDHGRHWHNVKLPTNTKHDGVYTATPFGNFVTDVRVRPKHANEVVAAVGWRRGAGTEPNGKIDSVGNGLYQSTKSGGVGTFKFVPQDPVSGLAVPNNNASPVPSDDPIGRTSLAYSSDGKYLWAVVQDAGNFRGETFLAAPLPATNTVLNGVYVSTSGSPGKDWVPKGNSQELGTAPGSGLLVEQALLYAPGVQSWYDQWIAVDPGDDNRVLLGLEEVYEAVGNQTTAAGYADWRTVSRYWNGCAALDGIDCSQFPGPVYAGDTTHPDQHAYSFVKNQDGSSTLYTGSDGGIFRQNSHDVTDYAPPYTGYDNSHWSYLNTGLATTQPYYAVEGSDGTIYAGLQDNGTEKLLPGSTRGDEVYGGDGFDVATVPGHSNDVYEEYTYGNMNVSTDGGHNWVSAIQPCEMDSTHAQFSTPFMVDPKNANHLTEVGNSIFESTQGVNTASTTDPAAGECLDDGSWKDTFDLGASPVASKPGVSGGGVNNIATAVTDYGAHMYVPYCGLCDPISQGHGDFSYFHNGIATNVKKGCTAKVAATACWHKAAAKGLPNRYVMGAAIDPKDPRTVYVALSGYLRRWYPNGTRTGPIWVSHDAGQHFANISGNLPDVPGNAIVLRNGKVFVGTDRGIYVAKENRDSPNRTSWQRVGTGLPNSSVLDLRMNPQGSQLVAATHGRGIWTYSFGSKADKAYRQRAGTTPPVTTSAPAGPTPPSLRLDPGLLAAGIALLVTAAVLPRLGRRRALA
jgi:hypothetical protein